MGKITKSRPAIPNTVKMELWSKAGGRCEFLGCNKPLWRDGLTFEQINDSNVAHIIACSPDGPRGDEVLSKKLATDISNLMLTCPEHHKLIDAKELEAIYSQECLENMKKSHENRIEAATSILPENKSTVIKYSAKIGSRAISLNEKEIFNALFPKSYPDGDCIELGLKNNAWDDTDPNYWLIEKSNLEALFNTQVKSKIENGIINHVSVFGFAPQPLLILLGNLISDKCPANVFQLNRENADWSWRKENEDINYKIIEPTRISKSNIPVLNISLSGIIAEERIKKVIPNSDIWTFTLEKTNPDFLTASNQLYIFKYEIRTLLDKIKQNYPEGTCLNIFPAMPVSTCIEFGRLILPKADMSMNIYNQMSIEKGFVLALTIGGEL